jgi:hypothetical protein
MEFSMIKKYVYVIFAILIFTGPAFLARGDDPHEDSEAMELGGLLTLDGANKFKDWESTEADLSRVELSSIVHVGQNLEGSITLMSATKPDSIVLYQAVGQWTLPNGKVIFGRQAFNASLLTTRIVSLPLMYNFGEVRNAGVTLLAEHGPITYGFGLTSLVTGPDSASSSDPNAILNFDYSLGDNLSRMAVQASKLRQAVDGAVNLKFGPVNLDAEGMWRWKDEDEIAKGGFAVGIAYQLTEMVSLAGRWDGIINEQDGVIRNEDGLNHQYIAGCLTVSPIEHAFGAAEIGWDEKDGPVFDLQLGLQSTLKLPGFQRKTLTK